MPFDMRTNRRRKIKLGEQKMEDDDEKVLPRILSCKFLVKTMSMCTIGCPLPHLNFNMKIYLEQTSK